MDVPWRVCRRYLEGMQRLSGRCVDALECVGRLFKMCEEAGLFGKGVWRVLEAF